MTRHRLVSSAFVLALLAADSPGHAQGPPRRSSSSASRSELLPGREEPDPFRPYNSRGRAEASAYVRRSALANAEPPRPNFYTQRHNYYPGQRTGQGPNRNTPGPLCVPWRGVMFMGR